MADLQVLPSELPFFAADARVPVRRRGLLDGRELFFSPILFWTFGYGVRLIRRLAFPIERS